MSRCLQLMLCIFLVSFFGCGGETPPALCIMTGTVRLANGDPLAGAEIVFGSTEGFVASAPISRDGTYAVVSQYGKGLPHGIYKIMLTPADQLQLLDSDAALPRVSPKKSAVIPKKYLDFSTSGLQVVAEGSSQVVDVQCE